MSLLADERRRIEGALASSEILALAVAKLYVAHPNPREWSLAGHVGAVALTRAAADAGTPALPATGVRPFHARTGKTFTFTLMDVASASVLWSHDLALSPGGDCKYKADTPTFHSFAGAHQMTGFSFADEADATAFLRAVQQKETARNISAAYAPPPVAMGMVMPGAGAAAGVHAVPAPVPTGLMAKPPAPSRHGASMSESAAPRLHAPAAGAAAADPRPRKISSASIATVPLPSASSTNSPSGGGHMGTTTTKSFFGAPSSSKGSKKGKPKFDKSMIGAPQNFSHVSHVGYNPQTGFSAQNIPADWKIIFAKAGISEEQLNDKRTAKIVSRFMKEHVGATPGAAPAGARAPPSRIGTSPATAGSPAGSFGLSTPTAAPAIPPSGTRRAPPPPPPSRGTARGPPPPPPPSRMATAPAASAGAGPPPPQPQHAMPVPMPMPMPAASPVAYAVTPPPALPSHHAPPVPAAAAAAAPAPPPPPPIPSRDYPVASPPAPPSYGVPAPPPIPSRGAGGPPPPPPPPPPPAAGMGMAMGMGGPPPPPAPPMGAGMGAPGAPPRGMPAAPMGDGRSTLLDSIRSAGVGSLRKVEHVPQASTASDDTSGDGSDAIAAALKAALAGRKNVLADSDSDDEDEDEDDW
ncbi:hypothetical protein CXG81DRAFT_19647 [Caulochytrium protostelioides]|uniref:WH1-domain-containing protein n=1 Tax=Caulochytrium protostelioides TaxID=1555241 RepID=A0A4V1IUF7_9FUNG|nr:hypothetical protein CXG81DRAFT_19647 [Caulochytrium protostelioides]|eukprot:RKP00399.1 hypothetical protein CXG81DRAFT_19647 [Caulochytrium protostelioides]